MLFTMGLYLKTSATTLELWFIKPAESTRGNGRTINEVARAKRYLKITKFTKESTFRASPMAAAPTPGPIMTTSKASGTRGSETGLESLRPKTTTTRASGTSGISKAMALKNRTMQPTKATLNKTKSTAKEDSPFRTEPNILGTLSTANMTEKANFSTLMALTSKGTFKTVSNMDTAK